MQYLGLHGWDGRMEASLPPETLGALEDARKALAESIEPLQGVWIEDKGPTFAIHYRGATDVKRLAERANRIDIYTNTLETAQAELLALIDRELSPVR